MIIDLRQGEMKNRGDVNVERRRGGEERTHKEVKNYGGVLQG